MPYGLLAGGVAFSQVEGDWEALEDCAAVHVFQTYDFARIWYETAGKSTRAVPLIVTYVEDGRTVALFPACLVRYGAVTLLTWLSGPHVLGYGDILFDATASISAEEFVDEALRRLRSRAPLAFPYLGNVRTDAAAYPALAAGLRVYKQGTAPYLPISGDFEAYVASLSRHRRHDLRRTLAKLDQAGDVRFRLLGNQDPALTTVIDDLVALKRQRFGATAFRGHAEAFRRLQAKEERHTFVAVLDLDGRTVAAELGCIYRGRMYLLLPAYDDAYQAYAPGKALRYHLVRECFYRGLEVCDFGWGDERHKYRWTELETGLTTFVSADARGALLTSVAGLRRRMTAARG